MNKQEFFDKIENGLIISCYAGPDINPEMGHPLVMAHMAKACLAGGANAIRTNAQNVTEVRKMIGDDVPLIAIKKIYENGYDGDFRITPTMDVVDELVSYGCDAIAIDATQRKRYDELTLEEYVAQIKEKYPELVIIADISTVEEGVRAWKAGVDIVGSTLSGYTPYSKNPIVFGSLPTPDPDYEILTELKEAGVGRIIAEGRYDSGEKLKKGLEAGANAVVIGTSITQPSKVVKNILMNAGLK